MATRNRAHLIGNAIQSVVDQKLGQWELVGVDDGSADNTEAVIKEWEGRDSRIHYKKLDSPGSIAVASNAGLWMTRGKFVAILDDDDWWIDPQKLEKQIAFLDEHPDYVGCGGGMVMVDERGTEIGRALKPETDMAIRKVALFANPMANSTAIFRRSAAEAVHGYDETLPQFADWDFWLKLGERGKLYNVPEYGTAYRMHHGSSSFLKQRENATSAIRIVKRYRHDYPGFFGGLCYAYGYWCYTLLPGSVRRSLNGILSRLKKKLFSG
jgi:glycosyltransferase involved in cell wall biosynthesis